LLKNQSPKRDKFLQVKMAVFLPPFLFYSSTQLAFINNTKSIMMF